MSSSSESDSEEENHRALDSVITKVKAKSNYNEAGEFIEEDQDQINILKYGHLVKPSNESIFNSVVSRLDLPTVAVCPLTRIAQCAYAYSSQNMHFNPMVF